MKDIEMVLYDTLVDGKVKIELVCLKMAFTLLDARKLPLYDHEVKTINEKTNKCFLDFSR